MATTRAVPVAKYLADLCDSIEQEDSWLEQARRGTDVMNELQAAVKRLAAIKAAAIRALFAEGWTVQEIGTEVGVSRARVHQILIR